MCISLLRYVNDVMQTSVNKECQWLMLLHPEERSRSCDSSMLCIEKSKQLEMLVTSKARTQYKQTGH